jgi:hypothetical protein
LVNAYVEPVVIPDPDIVVAGRDQDKGCQAAARKGFKIESCEHSINSALAASDLRIQLQTGSRYQDFIFRARPKKALRYKAKPEDSCKNLKKLNGIHRARKASVSC